MIHDPYDRHHRFDDSAGRWPKPMRDFLRNHFRAWDTYRSLSDPCLNAALMLEKLDRGERIDRARLKPAIALLESCGFHSLESFTRTDPSWQVAYIIPFFADFFDLEEEATERNIWHRCNDTYLNLKRILDDSDGDYAEARKFFLDLNRKSNLELHEPIRTHYLEA